MTKKGGVRIDKDCKQVYCEGMLGFKKSFFKEGGKMKRLGYLLIILLLVCLLYTSDAADE